MNNKYKLLTYLLTYLLDVLNIPLYFSLTASSLETAILDVVNIPLYFSLTASSLETAILDVLNTPLYSQNMKQLITLIKDRPTPLLEVTLLLIIVYSSLS